MRVDHGRNIHSTSQEPTPNDTNTTTVNDTNATTDDEGGDEEDRCSDNGSKRDCLDADDKCGWMDEKKQCSSCFSRANAYAGTIFIHQDLV